MRNWRIQAMLVAWIGLAAVAVAEPDSATVITSKQLTFDYKQSVALFDGDVVVVDPEVHIEADRMNVMFEGTNSVKSLTASGNVRILQGDKRATCDRAVYVARTGEVVLRGNAQLERTGDRVMGDEITFWLNEDRMTCTPGRLIIGAESMGRSGTGRKRSLEDTLRSPTRPTQP